MTVFDALIPGTLGHGQHKQYLAVRHGDIWCQIEMNNVISLFGSLLYKYIFVINLIPLSLHNVSFFYIELSSCHFQRETVICKPNKTTQNNKSKTEPRTIVLFKPQGCL